MSRLSQFSVKGNRVLCTSVLLKTAAIMYFLKAKAPTHKILSIRGSGNLQVSARPNGPSSHGNARKQPHCPSGFLWRSGLSEYLSSAGMTVSCVLFNEYCRQER